MCEKVLKLPCTLNICIDETRITVVGTKNCHSIKLPLRFLNNVVRIEEIVYGACNFILIRECDRVISAVCVFEAEEK